MINLFVERMRWRNKQKHAQVRRHSRELARLINELQLSSTGTYPVSTNLVVLLTPEGVLGLHAEPFCREDALEEQAKSCTSS